MDIQDGIAWQKGHKRYTHFLIIPFYVLMFPTDPLVIRECHGFCHGFTWGTGWGTYFCTPSGILASVMHRYIVLYSTIAP